MMNLRWKAYFKLKKKIVGVCVLSHSVVSDSLCPHGLKSTRLLCPWTSPGKNTGVGSYSLLQGIFLTQESNQGLLHCGKTLYQLSYQGSPVCIIGCKWKEILSDIGYFVMTSRKWNMRLSVIAGERIKWVSVIF